MAFLRPGIVSRGLPRIKPFQLAYRIPQAPSRIPPTKPLRLYTTSLSSIRLRPQLYQFSHAHLRSQQCLKRHYVKWWTPSNLKILWRHYPFSVSLAFSFIAFGIFSVFFVGWYYVTWTIGAFKRYPEPVAKCLRKALYYTKQDFQPLKAFKYFKQALIVADDLDMDPVSDEVVGIKITCAGMMEKAQAYPKAIEVLETLKSDLVNFVEEWGDREGQAGRRQKALTSAIKISVKLGDLYAGEYVMEEDLAEQNLVWALETSLKEKKRREDQGEREGETTWLSDEEFGASAESLADHYEQCNQHNLSAPLYLHALAFSPPPCHQVVLMNNLSISLAQQPSTPETAPREVMINNAKTWALKALELERGIKAADRDDECSTGCVVALYNLASFAEMEGKVLDARKRYRESEGLARKIFWKEGIERAQDRLKALENE